jgi:hypothetical protein
MVRITGPAAGTVHAGPAGRPHPGRLNGDQQLSREIYKELVEINTGVETGDITAAAQAMVKRFRAAGIPEADIFIGGPQPKKHNVVARIRGKGGPNAGKPLLLLAHIDVVEALKADWSPDLDPFVFTEREGYYYGRGTADDKAMASIFVANVFRMKQEGYVPDRDIIIALTADEESGPFNGVDWLTRNHRDLVDAAVVINEGGAGCIATASRCSMACRRRRRSRPTSRCGQRTGAGTRRCRATTTRSPSWPMPSRKWGATASRYTSTRPRARSSPAAPTSRPRDGRASVRSSNPGGSGGSACSGDPRAGALRTVRGDHAGGGHARTLLPQLAEANINAASSHGDRRAGARLAGADTPIRTSRSSSSRSNRCRHPRRFCQSWIGAPHEGAVGDILIRPCPRHRLRFSHTGSRSGCRLFKAPLDGRPMGATSGCVQSRQASEFLALTKALPRRPCKS